MSSRSKSAKGKIEKKGLGRGETIAAIAILFVIVWIGYSLSQPSSSPSTTTQTSRTTAPSGAPDFTLPVVGPNGLTGQSISLSSYRGKVVLLEFMEPWCGHCQNMAPVLERLYQQYGKDNVVFISVAGPWQGANVNDAAKFIRDYKSTWTYVFDSSGTVFSMYGVTATPTFFVISKDGSVANRYEGEIAYDILAADLSKYGS